MSKKLVRIFAFVLCLVTLTLSLSAVAFAADTENVCKKQCANYASRITKSYTVTSSWPFYAKDQFTIYKDNKGAIIGYDIVQIKKGLPPYGQTGRRKHQSQLLLQRLSSDHFHVVARFRMERGFLRSCKPHFLL